MLQHTARADTTVGDAFPQGKKQLGVFKRRITRGRNALQVLALFKSKATHRPVDFDIMKVSEEDYDVAVPRLMNETTKELVNHGRVGASNKRK